MWISVTGEATSGKDTFSNMLEEELLKFNITVNVIAFATKLKESLSCITGIPLERFYGDKSKFIPEFGMTIREMMQKYGDITRQLLGDDLYVRCAARESNTCYITLFSDARHLVELKWLHDNDCIMFRINRDVEKMNHRSETEMDKFKDYTFYIDNNLTLSELRLKAQEYAALIRDKIQSK